MAQDPGLLAVLNNVPALLLAMGGPPDLARAVTVAVVALHQDFTIPPTLPEAP